MTRVEVHIERLVLDGLPLDRRQGRQVQAAIEAELTRLLAVDGGADRLMRGEAVPGLSGGTVAWNGRTAMLGEQVAQAAYKSFET